MRDVFFDTSIPIEDEETSSSLDRSQRDAIAKRERKEDDERDVFFCSRRGGPAHRHTHRKKL